MRRIASILAILLGASGLVVLSAGAGDSESNPTYKVELDNAFGLIEGADLKIAGVRAGKILAMELDRKTKRAVVEVEVTKNGFGSLRQDVRCETRPQSLIGEYYIDCLPGTAKADWPQAKVIPVERTASTVAPDLVNNILRLPERQRLRLILGELGAGVASRGEDLNAAIRRFVPAIRETEQTLAILARQNQILADLARDGDRALRATARNKKDVARWVSEANDTAQASAERQEQLAEGFRELPDFLRELGPTMRELGKVASEQTPALQDLNASADQLETFFRQLEPFTNASEKATSALGEAAEIGGRALTAARPSVEQLGEFAKETPELGKNLAIVLEDLDDRDRTAEHDPRANGGEGYSGLEALLQYVFDQTMGVNVFDQNGYLLKVNAFVSECSEYQNAETLEEHGKEFYERCYSQLGPNQPGTLGQPDPTAPGSGAAALREKERRADRRAAAKREKGALEQFADEVKGLKGLPAIDLQRSLDRLFGGGSRDVQLPRLSGGLGGGSGSGTGQQAPPTSQLLDYLLSP